MIDHQAIAGARRALGRRLAELRKAAGYSQEELAPLTLHSRSSVANVETGRQHVSLSFWQRCDEALSTEGELTRSYQDLVALIRRQHEEAARKLGEEAETRAESPCAQHGKWSVTWDPMRRRTVVNWGLTTVAALGLGAGSVAVGSADVVRLQRAETFLYRLARQHGGGMLWQAAAGAADDGYAMLEQGSYGASVGRQLLIMTSRLQICAGYLAFDAGRHNIAQACNEGALTLARQADDPAVESQALADLARGSYVLNRPREAQRLANAAVAAAASDSVSARLSVIPLARRAVASSLMADARGAGQAIRQARITLDSARDEQVEEWCAFVTPLGIDGIEATCALELGQAARAERLLERVVIGCGPRFRRARAFSGAQMARARLENNEVEGAVEAATTVLDDLADEMASWKVSKELGTVACRLADHPTVDGVGQFLERYRTASV